MSDTASKAPHQPGVYVKGDSERVANTVSRAAALVFEGYALKDESPAPDADYRDLQAQAKELGISANQKADALREQIDAKLSEPFVPEGSEPVVDENPDAPDTGEDSLVTGTDN